MRKKKEATVGDLLAAIFDEDKTYALHLLEEQKISKLDILQTISHKDIQKTKSDKESSLEKYCVDLIEMAKVGKIDPIIGREEELSRMMQTLCRRKKNNPILVGEPGVGKTAIIEGLASKVVEGKVPRKLQSISIYSLDLGAMLAGTKYRGDFEKRLKSVIDELAEVQDSILFIDEIHTLIGAGSVNGSSMDAANQLKPALEKGDIKCIGATTYAEYRNIFDKDRALSRRFFKVDIKEPNYEDSYKIIKGLKSKYEGFHNVKYNDSAIKSSIELSKQYIHDRFLPDVAIDLIDEVGASFNLSRKKRSMVTKKDIHDLIAKNYGIPTQNVDKNDLSLLKELDERLMKKVLGQDEAVNKVSMSIKRARAGLKRMDRPVATFLFTGPTGVGKTELAKSLAEVLGIHFERIDMSEYMEKHAVSKLIGSPPGYVGYEQGGQLTESIRKHPYSVLLLDEIEKAHPDLINILLQVMDNASLVDNNGNKADFKNVIIIMTSNVGASEANVMGFASDSSLSREKAVKSYFTAEFRNRIDSIIQFHALEKAVVEGIVDKFVDELNIQLADQNVQISLSAAAKKHLADLGYDKDLGARPLQRVIQEYVNDNIVDILLYEKDCKHIEVDFKKKALTFTKV